MAKFGEGDARWIVEKREDGTNVNNWHWTEKDCMAWSKSRLEQLFANLTLVAGSPQVHTTHLESVQGDAILNVRKAKLIPSYELCIKVKWEGKTAGGDAGSGLIELPYVADENHDEDPEIRVVLPVEDKACQALKEAILTAGGKQAILKAVHTFVSELRSGVPAQQTSSSSSSSSSSAKAAEPAAAPASTAAAAASSNGTSSNPAAAAAATNAAAPAAAAAAKPKSSSRQVVKLTERFYAKATDIYECFVVQGRVQAFTRSPAVVEPHPGGSFSWFNGHVQGKFEELQPSKQLVFSWRFNNWEDGCFSKVVIDLAEPEPGNTVLSLTHTGLPEEDKFGHSDVQQQVEEGWKQQVFSSIKAIFGYGV